MVGQLDYQIRQTKELKKLAEEIGVYPPKGNYSKFYQIQDCIDSSEFPWIPILTNDNPKQLRLGRLGLVLRSKEDRVCFTSILSSTDNWNTLPFIENRAFRLKNEDRVGTTLSCFFNTLL
jgi:hypothetical protein